MSFNKNNNVSTMAKFVEMLRQMSNDIGADTTRQGRRPRALAPPGRGYLRVPSRGTISNSTTSTSLAAECDALQRRDSPAFQHEEQEVEEELQGYLDYGFERQEFDEEDENSFEAVRLHFQQLRQISLNSTGKPRMEMETRGVKDDNLRTAVPFVRQLSDTGKMMIKDDYSINGDASPYAPTTQKIYILTQILAAISVSLGSLVVGFSMGYTSSALNSMQAENSTIAITKHQGSWVGGLMPLAALLGGVVGGALIEYLGRRNTILLSAAPFIASWLIIAAAPSIELVYVGRALGGLCVGVGSLSFPVYLGETVQPEVRGQLGLLPTIFGNFGILVSYTAGTFLDWSDLAYLGAVLPLPFLVLMFLIPETPTWYVASGKPEKARESLQWLRGQSTNIEREMRDIVKSHEESQKAADDSAVKELFKRNNMKPLLISLGLMLFQQMSGITAVIFYTETIFRDAGITLNANVCTIIVGIVNFGATFVTSFVVDKLGRKVLLYISGVTMTITLAILGAFFYVKHVGYNVEDYGWMLLITFVVYVISFSVGFGPIPWLMMGEILPAQVRGAAASIATAFNWMCTFLISSTFIGIIDLVGRHGTFWLFGSMCVAGVVFTAMWVPETQGKSLDDIERKLAGKPKNSNQNRQTIGC